MRVMRRRSPTVVSVASAAGSSAWALASGKWPRSLSRPTRGPTSSPTAAISRGCSYQHIAYARQLEIKAGQVEQTLRRVGRLETVPMRPIVAAPQPYGYRNRIRVHSEGGVTGFYAHDARVLVDIEQCLLAVPEVNRALRRLRETPVREGD